MTFEFLIACHIAPETDVEQILAEVLSEALQNNQNDFVEDAITDMVHIRHRRPRIEDISGGTSPYTLIGFSIELSEETDAPKQVIDDFAKALSDGTTILHAVRFEDPLLESELKSYAEEIFAIEMKLRRVLSFVYLHAYEDSKDAYNLLQDETVNPRSTPPPTKEQMESATENEFFHLYFSDYRDLNRRRTPNLNGVIALIQNTENYEILRNELIRTNTINDADDAILLADLKQYMNPIEAMRNCVAHYRRPSNTIAANYDGARSALDGRLNQYLAEWEI